MMVYLPAIFFGLCFLNSIRKYGWNVEALLFSIYFVTGIASILLDANNLYDYNCLKMDLGFFAPIAYCLLLYICIKPFGCVFRQDKLEKVYVKNERIIDYYIYFHFIIFLIILIVASTRINEILFSTALSQVRREAYDGVRESFYNAYTGIPRYICALSTFFYASSYICIFLFFYNLKYRRKTWLFHIVTLFASTPQLISSILQADRSQFLYWMILFVFSFTIYVKQIDKHILRRLLLFIVPIISGIVAYFVAVSISRWGEGDSSGWIKYLGMNYFNCCNFFNNLWGTPTSLCEIFPFTYMLFGDAEYFSFARIVEQSSHMFIATFPTYLGLIFSISGPLTLTLYIFFYYIISINFLKRKRKEIITLYGLIKMWIVALVPLLGVFGYFYMSYTATLAILFWLLLGFYSNRRWIRR